MLIGKRQGPNHHNFAVEHGLTGNHGADFTGITNVQKEGFDDIVPVMTQRELAASHFGGQFKKPLAPEPGTQKAGVFPIFPAMRPHPVVRMFDPQFISHFPAVGSQGITESPFETRINMDGGQFIVNRNSLQPFAQYVHKKEAVDPATEPNGYPVTMGYHPVAMDGLADTSIQPLVYSAGIIQRHTRFFRRACHSAAGGLFGLFFLTFCSYLARSDFPKRYNDIFIFRRLHKVFGTFAYLPHTPRCHVYQKKPIRYPLQTILYCNSRH